jgi:hypothetical protein
MEVLLVNPPRSVEMCLITDADGLVTVTFSSMFCANVMLMQRHASLQNDGK